jgi:hypothetical protein
VLLACPFGQTGKVEFKCTAGVLAAATNTCANIVAGSPGVDVSTASCGSFSGGNTVHTVRTYDAGTYKAYRNTCYPDYSACPTVGVSRTITCPTGEAGTHRQICTGNGTTNVWVDTELCKPITCGGSPIGSYRPTDEKNQCVSGLGVAIEICDENGQWKLDQSNCIASSSATSFCPVDTSLAEYFAWPKTDPGEVVNGRCATGYVTADASIPQRLCNPDGTWETPAAACVTSGPTPCALSYPGSYNLSLIASGSGTVGTTINGDTADDESGRSVSSAGDVNGDGYDDILIGARYGDPGGRSNAGETYLVWGKAGGINLATLQLSTLAGGGGTNGVVFNGNTASDQSGFSVSSAGDVNGDGYDDILIGAPYGAVYSGETYLIWGKATWSSGSFNLSALAAGGGANGVVFNGITGTESGRSVSSAGDVNKDGYDDILIGAYVADPAGRSDAGETYLVWGKATWSSGSFDLSSLRLGGGTNGVVFNGGTTGDRSGWSVSSAGDVNKDGYDDILIGAPSADTPFAEAGKTYLVWGKATWSSGSFELSSLPSGGSTIGVVFNGISSNYQSGRSVSSAGDVNGDGYDDILIGASLVPSYAKGETYLIWGKSTWSSSSFNLSTLTGGGGADGVFFNGEANYDQSGESVSSAGDVNGDGYDDILIGAFAADPSGRSSAGKTYLIWGKSTWSSGKFELSTLAAGGGTNGVVFNGDTGGDASGYWVSSARDVSGEGYDDILIGAYGGDPGGRSSAGETYLLYGCRQLP